MLRAALATLLTVALLPAAAQASTASSDGSTVTLTGGAEANDISFPTTSFSDVAIEDLAGITAGAGCTQREPTVVTCAFTGVNASLGGGDDRWSDSGVTTATIDGGPGDDKILAGQLDDILIGGEGNDELDGDSENDKLYGGPGDDVMFGDDADDFLDGGPGSDRMNGDGPTGVLTGNDTLLAADGEQDLVDCSFGADTATVDAIDTVANCEDVAAQGDDPGGGDPGGNGALKLSATAPRKVGRSKFATKGVSGTLEASESGRVTVVLSLSARQAGKAGLGSKAVTLTTLKGPIQGGLAQFRVVPAKRFRAKLAEAGPFKATVAITLVASGSRASATKTVAVG